MGRRWEAGEPWEKPALHQALKQCCIRSVLSLQQLRQIASEHETLGYDAAIDFRLWSLSQMEDGIRDHTNADNVFESLHYRAFGLSSPEAWRASM